VNNDGGRKVGFTAPSVAGQARVIGEALAVSGVGAETIGYVEGHGTGTRLGDPLEVAALNEAYRGAGTRIALGSVKPNIGHLDTAAGVVGLIKVVLGLEHGEIPPSLHFERANPEINFAAGPFYVPQAVEAWPEREGTRRGAVSSFGIGGTNAHVVLEAAPERQPSARARPWQVLPISARTPESLAAQCEQLSEAIGETDLADVAYTLSLGRKAFRHRRAMVARDTAQAASELRIATANGEAESHEVALLFPGQGAQRVGMGAALYREGGVYAEAVRESAGHLSAELGQDVLKLVLEGDAAAMGATAPGQAALFAVSYGLAKQWEAWGVPGTVLLGHSLGEYVAACVAGVFGVADAARLVAGRGRLMERARGGAMLAVSLDEAAVRELCAPNVDVAAVNGPQQCVLSGEASGIAALETRLSGEGHWARRLAVNYAFHSHLLDPVLDEFEAIARSVSLQAPRRRMVSSVTGGWLTDAEATDAGYWRRQMRAPVRFWEGLRTVAGSGRVLGLEMGPGQTLSGLARATGLAVQTIWPSGKDEEESLARALAGVWEKGVAVDWQAVHGPGRRRVVLPGIALEQKRHWLEPSAKPARMAAPTAEVAIDKPRVYAPTWRRCLAGASELATGPFLVVQGGPIGRAVSAALKAAGRDVVELEAGTGYARRDRLRFDVATSDREDYGRVLGALRQDGVEPTEIVHTLAVDAAEEELLERGFHAGHALVQALIGASFGGTLTVVSRAAWAVTGLEAVRPAAATLRGLVQVVPQEHQGLRCRGLDVAPRESETVSLTASMIVEDLGLPLDQPLVARRGHQLWMPDHEELVRPAGSQSLLREGGVYLITGGLGAIGLTIAQHLATKYRAKLALVSRRLPDARSEQDSGDFDRFVDGLAAQEKDWRRQNNWPEQGSNAPLKRALDRAAAAYIRDYLRTQGVSLTSGKPIDRSHLAQSLAIAPALRRMFESMLDTVMAEDIDRLPATEALAGSLVEQHPTLAPLFEFLGSCVAGYPEVMSGRRPGIEVLYPVGDPQALATAMNGMTPFSQYNVYAALLQQAILSRSDGLKDRPLRILEIGGGNGAVTRALLPLLRGRNVHYTFSDLGKSLVLEMARWARAEGHENVSTCVFDATKPWSQQGVDPATFDVVLGLDVVHATPDVSHTVGNLASLLAAEGLLLLLESVNPPRFFDLLFGLAEGWWSYTDTALRPRSPLLELSGWEQVFRSAGLEATAFPQGAPSRASTDMGLVVGRKPALTQANALAAVAAAGGGLAVEQADVTDERALRDAFARVEKTLGKIDGIVHTAGEMLSGPLMTRERSHIDQEFAAKVMGTQVLDRILEGRTLDFVALCSSIGAIAPGPGDAGYAAANAFLDAFASARSAKGHRTISIGWDRWEGVGLATRLEALYRRLTGQPMPPGMATTDALGAFEFALSRTSPPHVVVARRWPGEAGIDASARLASADVTSPRPSTSISVQVHQSVFHQRPQLAVPYAAPLGEVEERIAEIWHAVLGVDRVGRDDDLTDLGGDSLIAIQIVARLREAFRVNVTVKSIFEDATVSGLAKTIETLRWHAAGRPEAALAAEEEEGTL
jgi:acyl transferase domain-containing protein/acyl carrier protein